MRTGFVAKTLRNREDRWRAVAVVETKGWARGCRTSASRSARSWARSSPRACSARCRARSTWATSLASWASAAAAEAGAAGRAPSAAWLDAAARCSPRDCAAPITTGHATARRRPARCNPSAAAAAPRARSRAASPAPARRRRRKPPLSAAVICCRVGADAIHLRKLQGASNSRRREDPGQAAHRPLQAVRCADPNRRSRALAVPVRRQAAHRADPYLAGGALAGRRNVAVGRPARHGARPDLAIGWQAVHRTGGARGGAPARHGHREHARDGQRGAGEGAARQQGRRSRASLPGAARPAQRAASAAARSGGLVRDDPGQSGGPDHARGAGPQGVGGPGGSAHVPVEGWDGVLDPGEGRARVRPALRGAAGAASAAAAGRGRRAAAGGAGAARRAAVRIGRRARHAALRRARPGSRGRGGGRGIRLARRTDAARWNADPRGGRVGRRAGAARGGPARGRRLRRLGAGCAGPGAVGSGRAVQTSRADAEASPQGGPAPGDGPRVPDRPARAACSPPSAAGGAGAGAGGRAPRLRAPLRTQGPGVRSGAAGHRAERHRADARSRGRRAQAGGEARGDRSRRPARRRAGAQPGRAEAQGRREQARPAGLRRRGGQAGPLAAGRQDPHLDHHRPFRRGDERPDRPEGGRPEPAGRVPQIGRPPDAVPALRGRAVRGRHPHRRHGRALIGALAAELRSGRAALSLLSLRLAEAAGLLPAGTCARIPDRGEAEEAARELRARTGGALPPWPLPREAFGKVARALLAGPAPEPEAAPPWAGGGGPARAGAPRARFSFSFPAAALSGADLHADALRAARAALALLGARAELRRADSLRARLPPADLLVGNPPYGHVADAAERAFLLERLPALRGGEIDRYAAFLLRSLSLLRPGGTAALLVPDTWMTNARSGPLREAVLDAADLAAVCDLGKPFAAAKDTRVQAVVLVRRTAGRRPSRAARVLRGRERLADAPRAELRQGVGRGWQLYRSAAERRLCAALEAAGAPLEELCDVGYGLRTGDNARFVARRPPRPGEVALVGGEDVVPFALRLRPKALRAPTAQLRALAERQLGRPRVCVQRIRTNSRAPHARWLEAAPVPPDMVCLDSLSTLSCDDADRLWALLAVLGSVALQRYHRLRTTDVNVKPAVLRELPVPRALLQAGAAGALAGLSRARAAEAAAGAPHLARAPIEVAAPALERAIDAAVYRLFGLGEEKVAEAERGFWGPRFPVEFPKLAKECQTPRVA